MTFRSPRTLVAQISQERFDLLMRHVGYDGPLRGRNAKNFADTALSLIVALSTDRRIEFDAVSDRVAALGDERGRNAILIAADRGRDAFDAAMATHHGPVDSALWCLLEHASVFRRAEGIFFTERAREREHDYIGRFQTAPAPEAVLSSLPLDDIVAALVGVYRERGERADGVSLEPQERPPSVDGGARIVEIMVRRMGRTQTAHIYQGGDPIYQRQVPVLPDIIIFDPETGIVEVVSKHGNLHREMLANAFCDVALGREPPVLVERLPIVFEALRQPREFGFSPADRVRSIRLSELRTKPGKDGFECIRAGAGKDIYQWMKERRLLHLLDDELDRAVIEVTFDDGNPGSKGKTLKISLAGEDAVSFPKWSPREKAVGERLLRKWGVLQDDSRAIGAD